MLPKSCLFLLLQVGCDSPIRSLVLLRVELFRHQKAVIVVDKEYVLQLVLLIHLCWAFLSDFDMWHRVLGIQVLGHELAVVVVDDCIAYADFLADPPSCGQASNEWTSLDYDSIDRAPFLLLNLL